MGKLTYSEIEKDLPAIVKAELQNQDDTKKEIFTEEFAKKRRTLTVSYVLCLLLVGHRWYITGNAGMTIIQWVLVLCGIGILWVIIDLFLIPKMVRERNTEIAKSVLSEQKIIASNSSFSTPQPTVINVTNSNG